MLLTLDIGNSQVFCGVFEGQALHSSWRFSTDRTKTPDEYGILLRFSLETIGVTPNIIGGCIISSVVPPITPTFQTMVETFFHQVPLIVSHDSPLGLTIRYDNPHEIGTDRLVNAAAAFARHKTSLIIVDFGTATTFCTITSRGEYLGGAIAPGLKSAADFLHSNTAKLPNVDLVCPKNVIGKDTVSSMQSGLIFGFAGLVDEMVTRIQSETGQMAMVMATGGLASVIAPISRTIQEVRPFLTLEGLELLYRRIQEQS